MRRAWIALLLAGLLVCAGLVLFRPRPEPAAPPPDQPFFTRPPPPPVARPEPEQRDRSFEPEPEAAPPGVLMLSDDAGRKGDTFWMEQVLEISPELARGPLADLYLSVDAQSQAGVRLHLTDTELVLERVLAAGADGAGRCEALARAPLSPQPASWLRGRPRAILGALWRGGEISAWWNEQLVLTWRGAERFGGPGGGRAYGSSVRLGARRTLGLEAIRFQDDFMRERAGETWAPLSGRWELTSLSFPDRSANPFSLRATFGSETPAADRLYLDRLKSSQYGLGVHLGIAEGTLHIARITGGAPAARAGLQADDTIVRVNGHPADGLGLGFVHQLLAGRGGNEVLLDILRTGERRLLQVNLTPDMFRWGTPLEGQSIPPVTDADEALIVAGEPGWCDYSAQAAIKPLGAGGAGLAIAVRSPGDYVVLRWVGPEPAAGHSPEEREKLQLVQFESGRARVLAEKRARYRPYEFYLFRLDWAGEQLTASVDGARLFDARVSGLRRGRIGLYALRGEAVYFDDVCVAGAKMRAGGELPDRNLGRLSLREQDMEQWANAALEWLRNERSPWALHRSRFPGEQTLTLSQPRFDDLEVRLLAGEQPAADAACAVFRVRSGQAELSRAGWKTGRAPLGPGPYRQIVVRAGQSGGEALIDDVKVTSAPEGADAPQAASPLMGACDRVAIRGLKNLGAPGTARVSGSRTFEYTFDHAPADWKVESGRWGLLNKWICDPSWSWFGGRSETVAALWNKHLFGGSVSVEAHVALLMRRDEPPYDRAGYERPGDYNLVICGDGTRLDSGYTLICGGGGNYWTRLYRNGKVVAEATDEAFRLPGDRVRQPDKWELHQRWFHLRLEKIGECVAFYRDGRKAFEFRDPAPLGGGRVGFWTCENGALLARVRIAAESIEPGPLESRRSALYDDGTVVNLYDGESLTSVEPVALPAAIADALDLPPTGFAPAVAPPAEGPPGRPFGWRVVNGTAGGPMALHWKQLHVDPSGSGIVRMAVCIEPGAAVDFCLKDLTTARIYRWRMTGPEDSGQKAPLVGQIPGLVADGRWRAVQFDLGPSWRSFWARRGGAPPRRAFRPLLACPENTGYALAGFGVNHPGASYSVGPLSFLAPADVDHQPPRLARAIWPHDPDGDGASLRLVFQDPGGSGLNPRTLDVRLNGEEVPPERWSFDESTQTAAMDLRDWRRGAPLRENDTLQADIGPAADFAGNQDAAAVRKTWAFHVNAAAAKSAGAPEVRAVLGSRSAGAPQSSSLSLRDVTALGSAQSVCVEEVPDAPQWATDRRSLRVTALEDGTGFGFNLEHQPYDLAVWPYLAIEYKVSREAPFNLHFGRGEAAGEGPRRRAQAWRILTLGDVGDRDDRVSDCPRSAYLPRPADFVDDGTWRRSEVPLWKLCAASAPRDDPWPVHGLAFYDNGWRGNRQGMSYLIHSVRALPAARSDAIAFEWSAADLAGVSGYASAVDDRPDTAPTGPDIGPWETVEAAARRKLAEQGRAAHPGQTVVPDGWKHLHLRVRSAGGAWSPVVHYKFRVDNTPPRVVKTEPEDGGRLAGRVVRMYLAEDHALAVSRLQVLVNDQPFGPGHPALSYDPGANVLVFDARQAMAEVSWRDGAEVAMEVRGLADALGNVQRQPHRFSFRLDNSLDREGPRIARVRFCAPEGTEEQMPSRPVLWELSFALDFEETLGHVRALQDCRLDWTDDPATAAFGRRAVKAVALEDDGDVEVMLHKNAWYVDNLPLVHFDYKAEPGLAVDLQAMILGQWHTVRFLGQGDARFGIGQVAGVVADGQWRHAGINLGRLISQSLPNLDVRIVSELKLSAHGQPGTRRGAALWLDNLQLCPPDAAGCRLEWEAAPDLSGVAGYSIFADRRPDTEAPLRVTDFEPRRLVSGFQGPWFFHIRAQDEAGNWGPTRHFRVDY